MEQMDLTVVFDIPHSNTNHHFAGHMLFSPQWKYWAAIFLVTDAEDQRLALAGSVNASIAPLENYNCLVWQVFSSIDGTISICNWERIITEGFERICSGIFAKFADISKKKRINYL